MRYKAAFQPQFLLGEIRAQRRTCTKSSVSDIEIDPQSLTWDPFDEELREALDKRRYVSLSQDRALAAEAAPKKNDETKVGSVSVPPGSGESDKRGETDKDISNDTDMSLFEVKMPGVLTTEELEDQVDLDHWKLLAHGVLVEMTVSLSFSNISPANLFR